MRLKSTISLIALFCVIMFSSCKIKEAVGAYQPAEGRSNERKEINEEPVVEQKQVPLAEETIKQDTTPIEKPVPVMVPVIIPEIEEEPEVKSEPIPEPEVIPEVAPEESLVIEPEVTRSETFTVVEKKDEVLLKKYHVVIGSFGVQGNANRLKSSMSEGYSPIVIKNESGMYRVILKSFEDYKSAREEINKIKSQFKDAWVLINSNK